VKDFSSSFSSSIVPQVVRGTMLGGASRIDGIALAAVAYLI
jgi:hypothetical protein